MLNEILKNFKKKSKSTNKKPEESLIYQDTQLEEAIKTHKTYNLVENQNNLSLNNISNNNLKDKRNISSNNNKDKNDLPITNDFVDDLENYSNKKKTDDLLKKYCTLYNDEEMEIENNFMNSNSSKPSNQSFSKYCIKPLSHDYQQKKINREENLKTTGPEWFNMKAPEITPELKEDLKALQLKHIIDPARFYKKNDSKKLPKFFQVGRIVENITDGKKYRLKKSEVKNRIAEEILETDVAKNYSLRKFEELQGKRRKLGLKKMKINKYKLKNKKQSGRKNFVFK